MMGLSIAVYRRFACPVVSLHCEKLRLGETLHLAPSDPVLLFGEHFINGQSIRLPTLVRKPVLLRVRSIELVSAE